MLSVRRRDSAIARYVRARAATSATCEYLSTRIRNWFRASANRPRANSLCARSNASRAADSSTVGGLGGGGAGVGRIARTAACFCVVLTLETTGFLAAAAALRATGFGAAFLVFAVAFDLAAVFLAGRTLAADRADDLAAAALVALGLEGDFAFTARFALFAAGLAFERDVDRLNPFVRLLLMTGFSKGCSLEASSRKIGPQLTIDPPLDQRRQEIAGALTTENRTSFLTQVSTKKNVDGHRWLC